MVSQDRPLTESETAVLRWLLEHGSEESRGFLDQLPRAWVVGSCGCGCATVDLAVDGTRGNPKISRVIVDYLGKTASGGLVGALVWVSENKLSGLEIYGLDCDGKDITLPLVESLKPFG